MKKLEFAIVFAVTLSLGFSFGTPAFAGVGGGLICNDFPGSDPAPSGASDVGPTQPPQLVCNTAGAGGGPPATWYIPDGAEQQIPPPGQSNGRVPIDYVPNAGPWVKHLELDINAFFSGAIVNGYSDTLNEFLVVGPNSPAWTDWHEVIVDVDPGEPWIFTTVQITTFPPSNVIIQPSPANEVWVDFDPPLQPGTTIDIIKEIQYEGLAGAQIPFIEVHQYPTVAEETVAVAGETLSIDSTALILLGAQATMSWLIPVAVSAVGIGLVIVRKRI